jgi:hypothetical protein
MRFFGKQSLQQRKIVLVRWCESASRIVAKHRSGWQPLADLAKCGLRLMRATA